MPSEFDAILAAILQAEEESGQAIDLQAWVERYPEHAERLREFQRLRGELHALARQQSDPTLPYPANEPPALPTTVRYFGEYLLEAELARGGMGVVYRAKQSRLNRVVALKMILSGKFAHDEVKQRFQREAEAIAKLDHSHIVPIYEIGEHEGQQYYTMKFIDGPNLAHVLPSQPLRDSVVQLAQVARAMEHAHSSGIVHRDLKPSNILIDKQGTPHVADFGLAKNLEAHDATKTGVIVGTPSYMAPEQARSEKTITAAADIYALGAILYEAITGHPPFQGTNTLEIITKVLEEDPAAPRPQRTAADRDLAAIAMKCLEKTPSARYASAADLADDLQCWLEGEPVQARRPSWYTKVWRKLHRPAKQQTWLHVLAWICCLTPTVWLILNQVAMLPNEVGVMTQPMTLRWYLFPSLLVCLLAVYWMNSGRWRLIVLASIAQTVVALAVFIHVLNHEMVKSYQRDSSFRQYADDYIGVARNYLIVSALTLLGGVIVALKTSAPQPTKADVGAAYGYFSYCVWGGIAVVLLALCVTFAPFIPRPEVILSLILVSTSFSLVLPACVLFFGVLFGTPLPKRLWPALLIGIGVVCILTFALSPVVPGILQHLMYHPWYALGATTVMLVAAFFLRSSERLTGVTSQRLFLEGAALLLTTVIVFSLIPFHEQLYALGGFWVPQSDTLPSHYSNAALSFHVQTWLAFAALVGLTSFVARQHRLRTASNVVP